LRDNKRKADEELGGEEAKKSRVGERDDDASVSGSDTKKDEDKNKRKRSESDVNSNDEPFSKKQKIEGPTPEVIEAHKANTLRAEMVNIIHSLLYSLFTHYLAY
jgi:hypothetical protein